MKKIYVLFLFGILVASCGSPSGEENSPNKEAADKTEAARSNTKDDDRVSGSFTVKADGKTFQSTQLQDNYCDMTFRYGGEKSFIMIRLKDDITRDILMVQLMGNEDFITNPSGKIENFLLTSQEFPKAELRFIPGDKELESVFGSVGMANGSLTISEFDKGKFVASFSGTGGKGIDVMKGENLFPFEGNINLETRNVSIVGKEEQ